MSTSYYQFKPSNIHKDDSLCPDAKVVAHSYWGGEAVGQVVCRLTELSPEDWLINDYMEVVTWRQLLSCEGDGKVKR